MGRTPAGPAAAIARTQPSLIATETAGTTSSFAAAYQSHRAAVHSLARGVCGPRLAEDVTQEVFTRLWQHPHRFDPARGSLRNFLLTVTHNVAVDAVQSETARRAREERAVRRSIPLVVDLDRNLVLEEWRAAIVRAIEQLDERDREVVVAAFYGRRTYREVAVALSLPEGTVKTRIRRALHQLGAILEPERSRGTPVNDVPRQMVQDMCKG